MSQWPDLDNVSRGIIEVVGDDAGLGGGEAAVQVGHDTAGVGRTEGRLAGRS